MSNRWWHNLDFDTNSYWVVPSLITVTAVISLDVTQDRNFLITVSHSSTFSSRAAAPRRHDPGINFTPILVLFFLTHNQ
ncbi:hypothetical protein J6590_081787 [Homalodisca vitripennis]|nr:hypothetical protein J6590_081787 [Homalodisca vitripennis]